MTVLQNPRIWCYQLSHVGKVYKKRESVTELKLLRKSTPIEDVSSLDSRLVGFWRVLLTTKMNQISWMLSRALLLTSLVVPTLGLECTGTGFCEYEPCLCRWCPQTLGGLPIVLHRIPLSNPQYAIAEQQIKSHLARIPPPFQGRQLERRQKIVISNLTGAGDQGGSLFEVSACTLLFHGTEVSYF